MALQKQGINIPFGQGIETKTDPNQVPMGKLLELANCVFDKGGQLHKRYGFQLQTALPVSDATTLTTLNDNLIATGTQLYAYSNESMQWLARGTVQPASLEVLPTVRNSKGQTGADSATADNGLVCTVFMNGTNAAYQINDSTTGQIIVALTELSSNTTACPRVVILNKYFLVTYLESIAATPTLRYLAIPISQPTNPGTATTLSSVVKAMDAGYDVVVANNTAYFGWWGSDLGGAVRLASLSATLVTSASTVLAGYNADLLSMAADTSGSTPVIWCTFYDAVAQDAWSTARNQTLLQVLAPTQVITNQVITELTSAVLSTQLNVLYEVENTYSYSATRTDYIERQTITQSGTVGTASILARGLGLASKAFVYDSQLYVLGVYNGAFQPTYFLLDSTGQVILKLAYTNGYGYAADQVLPSISIIDTQIQFSYLFKDLLASVNKEQNATRVSGIYTQTGVNLAKIELNSTGQVSAETAGSLHLTGGILWQYDAVQPIEHSFLLYPEDIELTATTSGSMSAQEYQYQVTYEWTDAQGYLHRSAPSVPTSVTLVGPNNAVQLDIPTLRQTYKDAVRIVIYRWSVAQQAFYQVTSITSPLLNDTTVDSVAYLDTQADSAIIGNTLLYTTGGVVENIAAPASAASTLFKNRMLVLDAEDKNLVWYSKPILQGTPVEFSDLFTIFSSPTAGAQGPVGPITALAAMDDKVILFRKNAIYYFTGTGPDATGANNDFSEPVFITSVVGCDVQNSIVLTPLGLMFQSDKGIWLLGRDLSTQYIGAPVDAFNNSPVLSALVIPDTNQIRFTLASGIVLMYDYYYDQWGTFTNVPAIDACIYQGRHTYLNAQGQVLKEYDGFLDNSAPVLMSLSTAWIKLTDLQGYQRAYYAYLLSNYKTPHKLSIQMAYDYDPSIQQIATIVPDNFSPAYGYGPDTNTQETPYGSTTPYGGASSVEQWRIFFVKQKTQSVRMTITEIYDPSKAVPNGLGLTFSGLNFVIGAKKAYPALKPSRSTG